MNLDTSNPVYFLIDVAVSFVKILDDYYFWEVSLLAWIFGFIVLGMVVSAFWRGARG